jgi:nucleoside-diphosphate-sugar epimerase
VLEADGPALATCVLRPHLIFGPRDPHLIPRLIERGRARKLAIIGDGTNEVSLSWVTDAAAAHVTALERLEPGAAHAGKAYFLAQRDPVKLWDWINALFARLGLLPVSRHVPLRAAYTAGACLELAWRLLRRPGEPPMTRFVALQLARSHSYDPSPAERDFGHREAVDMEQATELLIAHLRSSKNPGSARAHGASPGTVPSTSP